MKGYLSRTPTFKSANAALPSMFKTAKFQIRQRRYQPHLTSPNLTFDFGGLMIIGAYGYWWVRRWQFRNLRLWVPPE